MKTNTLRHSFLLAALAAGLQACGGGGSGPSSDTAQIQGVVAVGAPVVGADIALACAVALTHSPITSGAGGAWSASVPLASLPCAAAASGGTVGGAANTQTLHSLVTAGGTVNITPMTDLLVALAAGTSPSAWFAAVTLEQLAAASQAAADAQASIVQALQTAGYTLPADFSPVDMAFTAVAGNAYDDLLEALSAAIAEAGTSYAAVLAQWAAATAGAAPGLPAPPADSGSAGSGNDAALDGGDGATATVAGTVYTRTANVGWTVLPGQSTGIFDAAGGTDTSINALQRWMLRNVPATVGTHACDGAAGLNIQLQDGGTTLSTAPSGGGCSVEVLAVTGSTITGRFSGTLINGLSGAASTMENGFFRLSAATGGGGALPAGEQGASFAVDGTSYRYTVAFDGSFNTYQGIGVQPAEASSPGFPLGVLISIVPSAPGTYACGSGYAQYMSVRFYWNATYFHAGSNVTGQGPQGSSCSVTVTEVLNGTGANATGTFEGTFSGTFVTEDLAQSVVVTDGRFRLIKQAGGG